MSLKRPKTPHFFPFSFTPFAVQLPLLFYLFPHPSLSLSLFLLYLSVSLISSAANVISLLHITFLFLFSSAHHFSSFMPFSLLWSPFLFFNGPEQQFHFHRVSKLKSSFPALVESIQKHDYKTMREPSMTEENHSLLECDQKTHWN